MDRRVRVPAAPQRVVLTEVLPFEVPPFFSNRRLYNFLVAHDVRLVGQSLHWHGSADRTILLQLSILFGGELSSLAHDADGTHCVTLPVGKPTTPYKFNVAKSVDDARTLGIPHPRSQLAIVEFYEQYNALMSYHANRSTVSIRRPHRLSRITFAKDPLHAQLRKSWGFGEIEVGQGYEVFRSYFVHHQYNNIYKFFESDHMQDLERRYAHVGRLDVARCFESIYTHSIEWAVVGKHATKKLLELGNPKHRSSFAERFDVLMRRFNDNETHGILIGSEVARVFAEILLQSVDLSIEARLSRVGLKRGVDYDIARFVDDYFLYFNDPKGFPMLKDAVRAETRAVGMFLNDKKEKQHASTAISPLSIAKKRVGTELVNRLAHVSISTTGEGTARWGLPAHELVTIFKTILAETGTEPADSLNYTLGTIEKRTVEFMLDLPSIPATNRENSRVVDSLISALRLSFYIYGTSPRVNPAVKLSRILTHIIEFAEHAGLTREQRSLIYDCALDGVVGQLRKTRREEPLQVEALFLLACVSRLPQSYLLGEEDLKRAFGIKDLANGKLVFENEVGHFALAGLLNYVRNRDRYAAFKDLAQRAWVNRVKQLDPQSTERTFLLLDGIACPYLTSDAKHQLMLAGGITNAADRRLLAKARREWFVNWASLDLGRELDLKRNQEVY